MRAIIKALVNPFFTPRFLKFAAVGASGVVVNLAVLGALEAAGVQINVASAVAIEVSVVSNFLIHYAWTFRDRRDHRAGFLAQCLRFHMVCLVGAAIQFLVFVAANMVWLITVADAATVARYHHATSGWLERWLWHPLVQPPQVGRWVYLSQLIGIACGTGWNYLLNFYWTWAERPART